MPREIPRRAGRAGEERAAGARAGDRVAGRAFSPSWWAPVAILVTVMVAASISTMKAGTSLTVGAIGLSFVAILLGPLLLPLRRVDFQRTTLRPLGWAILTGAVTGGMLVVYLAADRDFTRIASLSAGVAVLTYFLDRLALLLETWGARDGNPSSGALAIFALCLTAPVWLGPWAEVFASTRAFIDALVGVSPLTYLAVLAEYDYLHSQWFYVHTPLASLRFSYPNPLTATVAYAALCAACRALERRSLVGSPRRARTRID